MGAPKTPEECIVVVDPCDVAGDDSLCWVAVNDSATEERIEAYAAAKVAEATAALRKENAELGARIEAVRTIWALNNVDGSLTVIEMKALSRALDLSKPWKEEA